jgi:O-Antigen ligase
VARLERGLVLGALALIPWGVLPPAPWLHPRAQWSDVLLGLAVVLRVSLLLRQGLRLPRPRPVHAASLGYLAWAGLSWWANGAGAGGAKLLGLASLVALAALTAEITRTREGARAAAVALSLGAVSAALAAFLGAALFLAGRNSFLVGGYGDLVPGAYPRVQAGLTHPNLLASYAIAAAAVAASPSSGFSVRWSRGLRLLLALAVALTFSRAALGYVLAWLVAAASTRPRRILAAAGAAVSLTVIVALTYGNLALDPSRPGETRWLDAPSSRSQTAASAWETFVANPWLGIGPGRTAAVKDGLPYEAHLTPLNVAATLGGPALVCFGAIPLCLWRSRGRPLDRGLWGGMAGLALDALAQDIEDFRHLWVLFGWLDGGSARGRDQSP